MAMLYLLLELCSILVETFGRVPQPKEAIVGRPLKWTQSGCLLPHCRSKSFGGWYSQPEREAGLHVNTSSTVSIASLSHNSDAIDIFFVAGAIVFRLVTTLEAYLRTSGESNHHR